MKLGGDNVTLVGLVGVGKTVHAHALGRIAVNGYLDALNRLVAGGRWGSLWE